MLAAGRQLSAVRCPLRRQFNRHRHSHAEAGAGWSFARPLLVLEGAGQIDRPAIATAHLALGAEVR